ALSAPTLTITTGRSLIGSGAILGNVTMAAGSTLSSGGPGSNTIGTLTITNALVLQSGSTNLFQISKAGGTATNSQIVAASVTFGGNLTITGAGGVYAPGDTYRLFSAGSYSGAFGSTNLPSGTTWNLSNLAVNGTISVISVSPPGPVGILATNGSIQISFSGPGGESYRLWATTNLLLTPVSSTWNLLSSNVFGVSGTAAYTDAGATTNWAQRYYSVTVP
ncbi:MAG TPA: hypothetical protein VFC44_21105, partial [Candidatus Saccharimonadales bacterium]|nr:hypothetical protein [Candidatus Saccharimonadales bacterium]